MWIFQEYFSRIFTWTQIWTFFKIFSKNLNVGFLVFFFQGPKPKYPNEDFGSIFSRPWMAIILNFLRIQVWIFSKDLNLDIFYEYLQRPKHGFFWRIFKVTNVEVDFLNYYFMALNDDYFKFFRGPKCVFFQGSKRGFF